MPKGKPFKRFKPLTTEFAPATELAIEKIDNRVHKDIRASSATFGILQHMDKAEQDIGRLRRKAMAGRDRDIWEAKRLIQRGQSEVFPGIPAMAQRDVRQMRAHKPGIVPRAEGFK